MRKKNEKGKLIQSGVIPYRFVKGKLHIYLITSVKKGRWLVPKGVLEDDLTPIESAVLEAYEEAGLIGVVTEKRFGSYQSEKWNRETRVDLYPMKVLEAVSLWPEKGIRKRIVIKLERKELKARIANPGLQKILMEFCDYMSGRTG